MTGESVVVPFPTQFDKKTIDSEADMVDWAVYMYCVETKRYTFREAKHFGKLLWAEFQRRAAEES